MLIYKKFNIVYNDKRDMRCRLTLRVKKTLKKEP